MGIFVHLCSLMYNCAFVVFLLSSLVDISRLDDGSHLGL